MNNYYNDIDVDHYQLGIDVETFSIEEELKKHNDEDVPGWHVYLRLFMRPNRTPGGLIITQDAHVSQVYESCVGLVVAIGSYAYTDARYEKTGPWCKKGEWRVFARHNGYRIYENGIPYWYLLEDQVGKRVDDPRKISRDLPKSN